jgi:hypothetical protein
MENHGVKALDEHVVGRRHVTKFHEPMFFLQLDSNESKPYMAGKSNMFEKSPGGISIEKCLINVNQEDIGAYLREDIVPLWVGIVYCQLKQLKATSHSKYIYRRPGYYRPGPRVVTVVDNTHPPWS